MAPGNAADLLIVNGCVVTLDGRRPAAEAVAVRDGCIVGLGRAQALQELVGPTTRMVDAGGDLVTPAFHDPHFHLLSYARSVARVACDTHRTIAEIQSAIGERARGLPLGAWVRAAGYDERDFRDGGIRIATTWTRPSRIIPFGSSTGRCTWTC